MDDHAKVTNLAVRPRQSLRQRLTGRLGKRDGLLLASAALLGYALIKRSPLGMALSAAAALWGVGALPPPTAGPGSASEARFTGKLFVQAPAERVYAEARDLGHFRQLWPDISEVNIESATQARAVANVFGIGWPIELKIIADQPGEFFGFRVEHNGRDHANCLISFDTAPGDLGTIVQVRIRHETPVHGMLCSVIEPAIDSQVAGFLGNLKQLCEQAAGSQSA